MLKTVIVSLLFLSSTTLMAQGAAPLPRRALKITPNVVSQDQVGTSFLIPAVGSLPGANGTFFKSEVEIANYRDVAQRIAVTVLQRGVSGANSRTFLTIPAYSSGGAVGITSDDFLTLLGRTGLASIIVEGVTADGSADPNAQIDGFARVYTAQPATDTCNNSGGTVSQAMHVLPIAPLTGSTYSAFALGLRQDADYRTNVGIINRGNQSHRFRIDAVGTTGSTSTAVTVAAQSMDQVPLPAGNFGLMTVIVTMEDQPASSETNSPWAAYASSVDNRTGDGWTRHAMY